MEAPTELAGGGVHGRDPAARRRIGHQFESAAHEHFPGLEVRVLAFLDVGAPVYGAHHDCVVKRIERRTIPFHAADDARTGAQYRRGYRAILIENGGYRDLEFEFVSASIENGQIAVLGPQGDRGGAVAQREQHGGSTQIVILVIVARELIPPFQTTRTGIEHQQRVGEEVGAGARLRIEIGAGIAHGDEQLAAFRIEREGRPRPAAAGLCRIPGPGVRAELSRRWNGVELPQLAAARGVEGKHAPAHAEIAAGDANEYHAVPRKRRGRQRFTAGGIAGFDLPKQGAGLGIERQQAAIGRAAENTSVGELKAPRPARARAFRP